MSNKKEYNGNPLENVQSHDWNKERLEQLKHLMPDLFIDEGKLNISELKKIIDPENVNETERYEFRWFGKSNAKREAFTPTDATLVYDEERSVNPTESDNLIIEGENLAVLKLLSNSYREQVKCIYIDPPYNTGKDFVYSDKFNQDKKEYWEDAEMTENGFKIDTNTETDGRFHSNWLNMMYSRLLIARQLLKEDGVIFISRKYILVQLPEATDEKSEAYKAGYKKISDITIERNKRVVEKIIKEKKETTPDLFSKKESDQELLKGLGFKVFKLQKSNFPRVEFAPDPEKTEEENIELLKKYIKEKEAQLISAFNKDELITEILIKNGFKLNYTLTKQEEFKKNDIYFATDGNKETLICLDGVIADETIDYFKTHTDQKLIVLERALDTTKKWNLKHAMGVKFNAF